MMSTSFFKSSQYSQESLAGSFWSLSKGSHNLKRSIITLKLDAAKLSLAGGCFNLDDQNGDKFNKIEGELGKDMYRSLCATSSALALLNVHYCQRGLRELADRLTISQLTADSGSVIDVSQAQVNRVKEMRDVINQDYLVLEFQRGEYSAILPTEEQMFYIIAEKLEGSTAGIYLSTPATAEEVKLRFHAGVTLLTVDCKSKKFSLEKILELLGFRLSRSFLSLAFSPSVVPLTCMHSVSSLFVMAVA